MPASNAAELHTPQVRHAGRDLLSLALLDARNRTLRWCAAFDAAAPVAATEEHEPPPWLIGHAAWFQERWLARHVQRQRGLNSDAGGMRLASLDPDSDRRYDPAETSRSQRWAAGRPDPQSLRNYLADTLEVTLELLDTADDSDDALHFFRLALFHEDACAEALAEVAQAAGVPPAATAQAMRVLIAPAPALALRPPIWFAATRWVLGADPGGGGFVWGAQRWAHTVALPEFEIDAQAVSWAQFTEFTEDGGYDDARWWSAEGWQWVQRVARRVPRHVEQMRAGVLQRRFGSLQRVPLMQAVCHVSAHEAEAWCRWAGRRLPTEVEWDCAARSGEPRGFRWGAVQEWTASPLRPYPGHTPDAWSPPTDPALRAVRGASGATPARLHDATRRCGLPAASDLGFIGFRSCAA